MNHFRTHLCAICGEERSANQPRFLLAENTWEDKLTILQWNDQMAARAGIQVACGIDHVEELVIQWMTTGSLDYPFARIALGANGWRRATISGGRVDISGARPIGRTGCPSRKFGTGAGRKPGVAEGHSGCAARRSASGDPNRSGAGFATGIGTKRRKRVVRGFY